MCHTKCAAPTPGILTCTFRQSPSAASCAEVSRIHDTGTPPSASSGSPKRSLRSQVSWRLASWRVAAIAAADRFREAISALQDAPRAGDNRPRASPDGRRSDRRARAARALRRAIPPPSWLEALRARRACSARSVPGDRAPVAHRVARERDSRSRAAAPRSAARSSAHTSSARWMRCASFGWMRAAACGSSRARSRMQGRPAVALAACASSRARSCRRGLRQRREAPQQRAQVQHGAADQQRHACRARRCRAMRAARRARTAPPNSSRVGSQMSIR